MLLKRLSSNQEREVFWLKGSGLKGNLSKNYFTITGPIRSEQNTGKKIVISSKSFLLDRNNHKASYKEKVRAQIGKIKLSSHILTFKTDRKNFDQFIASGHVTVIKPGAYSAKTQKAFFYLSEDRILFQGNARVSLSSGIIRGEEIKLTPSNDTLEVIKALGEYRNES